MPATPRIGTIIAERRLVVRDSGELVRVSVGVPRRRTGEADWACPFRIHGAGLSRVEHGYGVDSMQALANALEGVRFLLDESGLRLGWNLGAGAVFDGVTGFTRAIPFAFGAGFARRMERLIDRELTREVQRMTRRATPRTRKRARPEGR